MTTRKKWFGSEKTFCAVAVNTTFRLVAVLAWMASFEQPSVSIADWPITYSAGKETRGRLGIGLAYVVCSQGMQLAMEQPACCKDAAEPIKKKTEWAVTFRPLPISF